MQNSLLSSPSFGDLQWVAKRKTPTNTGRIDSVGVINYQPMGNVF
jgi:hypothetical protein